MAAEGQEEPWWLPSWSWTHLLKNPARGPPFFSVTSSGGRGLCGFHPPPSPGDDDSVAAEKWEEPPSSVSKVTMAEELEEMVKSRMSSLDTDSSVLMLDTLHTEMSSVRFNSPPAVLRPPPPGELQGSSSKGKVAGEPARRGRVPRGGLISRVARPEFWEDKLWLSWPRPEQAPRGC